MKKIVVSFVALTLAITTEAQVKQMVTILCPENMDTVAVYDMNPFKPDVITTIVPVNGKAEYNTDTDLNRVLAVGSPNYYMPFFNDREDIEVDLVNRTVLKGSEINRLLSVCDNQFDVYDNALMERMTQLQEMATPDNLKELQQQAMALFQKRNKQRLLVLNDYTNTLIPVVYLPAMASDLSYAQLAPFMNEETPYFNHPYNSLVKG